MDGVAGEQGYGRQQEPGGDGQGRAAGLPRSAGGGELWAAWAAGPLARCRAGVGALSAGPGPVRPRGGPASPSLPEFLEQTCFPLGCGAELPGEDTCGHTGLATGLRPSRVHTEGRQVGWPGPMRSSLPADWGGRVIYLAVAGLPSRGLGFVRVPPTATGASGQEAGGPGRSRAAACSGPPCEAGVRPALTGRGRCPCWPWRRPAPGCRCP